MAQDDNKLDVLISEVFVDRKVEVSKALKKYRLDAAIIQAVLAVENVNRLDGLSSNTFVSSLSSSYLTSVNSIVARVKVLSEKEYLQYIVGELSKQILIRLIQKSRSNPTQVITHIFSGLKVACKLHGWNYGEIKRMMSFDLLHIIAAKNSNSNLNTADQNYRSNEPCYYQWKGSKEDLDDLSYNLKDRKTIKSRIEFMKLFGPHNGNIFVRFDLSHLDFVIVLFDELNNKKLISSTGLKAKHFTPLKAYAVDLENKVLIKSRAKQLKYRITKNKINYKILQASVAKWIANYKVIR